MAEQVLIPIAPRDVADRQVFNTGLSTVGRGGEDYLCGHCGHKMLGDFDLGRLEVEIVFQCGACGGHNIAPELEGRGSETAADPAEGEDGGQPDAP